MRTVRNYNNAEVPFQMNLLYSFRELIYRKIVPYSLLLHELGFNYCKIAKLLNVDNKTISKAVISITE